MTLRIGLWGASQSGKTTYLAALGLATLRHHRRYGWWNVIGRDDTSDDFLIGSTNRLLGRDFPEASLVRAEYKWTIRGDVSGSPLQRFGRALGRDQGMVEFELDVLDVPGRLFDSTRPTDAEWQGVLDHFIGCDGLVYLHDPTQNHSFHHVDGTLRRLANRINQEGRFIDRGLPHFLAVCVAKFDESRIFTAARDGNWVSQEHPSDIPLPTDPKAYFESIASDLVVGSINAFFHDRRIGYFVTSAIGFRTGLDGRIDLRDYANVRTVGGKPQILGEVRPFNVLEPLVWLDRQIRLERRRSSGRRR